MENELFVLSLAVVSLPTLLLACRTLPREQWQIMAAIPAGKHDQPCNGWRGVNLTFYGFLLASGCLVGVCSFVLLMAAQGARLGLVLALAAGVMGAAMLAARLVARLVEKKPATLTVAGGATVGLYLMVAAVWLYNQAAGDSQESLSLLPTLAALSIGYVLGEGVGRLACISFGCCYGRPLAELGPVGRKLFGRLAMRFEGDTKKIVYASGLAGVRVVPVQALTSFLHLCLGLASMYLFLEGYFQAAFGLSSLGSMGWRVLSERLRADFRGSGRLTAYQRMGLVNLGGCLLLLLFLPPGRPEVDLARGLAQLWDPGVILFCQLLWTSLFLATGLSKVTAATLQFHVREERI